MTELTCIVCPVGCRIKVETADNKIELSGQGCRRGEEYAQSEITAPQRVLTGIIKLEGNNKVLPVKTKAPIPKELIFKAISELKEVSIKPPVKFGQVVKNNLAGTGVALIATKRIE